MKYHVPEDETTDKMINDLAYVRHVEMRERHDTAFDSLFMICARAAAIYVEKWVEMDATDDSSLAKMIIHSDDLEDPSRALDSRFTTLTIAGLFMESLWDNMTALLEIEDLADAESPEE